LKEGETLWIRKVTIAQQWVHEAWKTARGECLHKLPEEYQCHAAVFNKRKATYFPPKWVEELTVDLLPDALKEIDCKVYPLSREERDLLHTFLAKKEDKGYIYIRSSPYTMPVFLISKKDSNECHIVIDYRQLNKWVIRDNGPLPNICT